MKNQGSKLPSIGLMIPCHNEAGNVVKLCSRLKVALSEIPNDIEVVIIDDASTDTTRDLILSSIQCDERFRLISLKKRSGQTGAYREAIKQIDIHFIVRMDGDLQDRPEDLWLLVEQINRGYDLVIGYRLNRSHGTLVKFLTKIYDVIIGQLLDTKLHSNSSSFIAFNAATLRGCSLVGNDHRYLPLIAMKRGAIRRTDVIVSHDERKCGVTKYSFLKKALFGFFELILFLRRYYSGFYDISGGK